MAERGHAFVSCEHSSILLSNHACQNSVVLELGSTQRFCGMFHKGTIHALLDSADKVQLLQTRNIDRIADRLTLCHSSILTVSLLLLDCSRSMH